MIIPRLWPRGVALLGAPRGQSDSIELNFFFQISKRTTRTGFQSDSARLRVRATTHFDKFRAASAQIMALSVRPSDVICGRRADRDRDARCPSSAACKLFAACRSTRCAGFCGRIARRHVPGQNVALGGRRLARDNCSLQVEHCLTAVQITGFLSGRQMMMQRRRRRRMRRQKLKATATTTATSARQLRARV